jgi:electron transfer flavoprotein alpha subunit
MRALVIAEHDNQTLSPTTLNCIACAQQLAEVCVIVLGEQVGAIAEAVAQLDGVRHVVAVEHPILQHPIAEHMVPVLLSYARQYQYVLAPASTFGKDLCPRLAASLDVGQISEVIRVIDGNTFQRPIYAGNAIQTVRSHDPIKVLTVRTTAFAPVTIGGSPPAPVETIKAGDLTPSVRHIGYADRDAEFAELTSARVVVAGGRGLQSRENFALIRELAAPLGAAVGASRAAVDAGFIANDHQVGQTGKVVAPELYIAVGISGAVQHIAGMKDSKIIVAINQDPLAPIFKVADYGLVGDLFTLIPELITVLKETLC